MTKKLAISSPSNLVDDAIGKVKYGDQNVFRVIHGNTGTEVWKAQNSVNVTTGGSTVYNRVLWDDYVASKVPSANRIATTYNVYLTDMKIGDNGGTRAGAGNALAIGEFPSGSVINLYIGNGCHICGKGGNGSNLNWNGVHGDAVGFSGVTSGTHGIYHNAAGCTLNIIIQSGGILAGAGGGGQARLNSLSIGGNGASSPSDSRVFGANVAGGGGAGIPNGTGGRLTDSDSNRIGHTNGTNGRFPNGSTEPIVWAAYNNQVNDSRYRVQQLRSGGGGKIGQSGQNADIVGSKVGQTVTVGTGNGITGEVYWYWKRPNLASTVGQAGYAIRYGNNAAGRPTITVQTGGTFARGLSVAGQQYN